MKNQLRWITNRLKRYDQKKLPCELYRWSFVIDIIWTKSKNKLTKRQNGNVTSTMALVKSLDRVWINWSTVLFLQLIFYLFAINENLKSTRGSYTYVHRHGLLPLARNESIGWKYLLPRDRNNQGWRAGAIDAWSSFFSFLFVIAMFAPFSAALLDAIVLFCKF